MSDKTMTVNTNGNKKKHVSNLNTEKWEENLQACLKNSNFMLGFCMLASICILAVFSEQIAPYNYMEQGVGPRFTAPCAEFWFGTDAFPCNLGDSNYLMGGISWGDTSAGNRCYRRSDLWLLRLMD